MRSTPTMNTRTKTTKCEIQLELEKEPLAVFILNTIGFREMFAETFDLFNSFYDNLKTIKCDRDEEEVDEAIDFVYQGIDWGKTLESFEENWQIGHTIMEIRIYPCNLKMPRYILSKRYNNNFTFSAKKEKIKDLIVTHSFIPSAEHHVSKIVSDLSFVLDEDGLWQKAKIKK